MATIPCLILLYRDIDALEDHTENGGVPNVRIINEHKEKKSQKAKTPRSASAVMRRRAAVGMTILVAMGATVAGKLFKVSIVDNKKYEDMANNCLFVHLPLMVVLM